MERATTLVSRREGRAAFGSFRSATRWALVTALAIFAARQDAAALNYTAWGDLGIVYSAPAGDAYYPSVIYDANGFGTGSPLYKMWYSDGSGAVFLVASGDGLSWGTPTSASGLGGDAHHVQVVYDPDCFGAMPCGLSDVKYKIWYWDNDADLYSVSAIAYAESSDGINWSNDQAITQDATMKLVTGAGSGWNRGSYGPIDVFYQSVASNTGTEPWDYSYVMYYDGTDGSSEFTGLAYSADGLFWTAYSGNPVLNGSATAAWDCSDAAYGTVYRDGSGYHFWYSGGGGDDGSGGCQDDPVHEGIGYASSSDGKSWTKDASNPIFHISDAVSHRNERVYTPAVVDDGSGILKMYYSAKATGGSKKIGLATNPALLFVDDDGQADVTSCDSSTPAFSTIQAAVTAAGAGDIIRVCPGTYNETNINVNKSLTIRGIPGPCPGPDPGAPVVDGGGANADGFLIAVGVDNVTIEGFFIRNFGVSPTGPGVGVGVKAYNPNADPVTNITVQSNQFDNDIWAGPFFYNEGQSAFDNIDVNCNVVNMGPWSPNTNVYGIECTNCTNSSITDNTVAGGYVGVLMTAQAQGGNVMVAGGNSITDNTVSDSAFSNIQIVPFLISGPGPNPTLQNVSILNNDLSNANNLASQTRVIAVYQVNGTLSNFTVNGNTMTTTSPAGNAYIADFGDVGGTSSFNGNTVTLAGAAPPSFFHGINVGGAATGNWQIANNVFEGNDLGPNSVGIRLRSTLPATSAIDISCNRIEDWVNGIRSDVQANAALISANQNSIMGNSANGFLDFGSATPIDAENNWWGCVGGPGAGGCDTVGGNVDYTPWATAVPACVNCTADAQCDDGLACNGTETCNLLSNMCQPGTPVDCSPFADQCNDAACTEPLGTCPLTPKIDGFGCNDGDACTTSDTCQGGVCVGTGGADVDNDGYCDGQEIQAGCNANDAAEIPPQPNVYSGGKGSSGGEILLTYRAPNDRDVIPLSDASCTTAGICGAGPGQRFCTAGKVSDPCTANGDCNQGAGTCRVVINYAGVADLLLLEAGLKKVGVPLVSLLPSFQPATPGCTRKVDIAVGSGFKRATLKFKASGTTAGRLRKDRDRIRFKE